MNPKYPGIEVKLIGENGNAFAIIGAVAKGLKREGIDASEIDEFKEEAMSGDYDNVLQTAMKWVTVQ